MICSRKNEYVDPYDWVESNAIKIISNRKSTKEAFQFYED